MQAKYYINEWAAVRRGEMVDLPGKIDIHPDFLRQLDRESFETAFRGIWKLFYQIYDDISKYPEQFSMPLVSIDEHYAAPKARQSREVAWRPFDLLYHLFECGNVSGARLEVDAARFRDENTVGKSHELLRALGDYGFVFDGLQNYRITPKTAVFFVEYPDNPDYITVLYMMARKESAARAQQEHPYHLPYRFEDSFISWSWRALTTGLSDAGAREAGPEYVADKMHNDEDRQFIYDFDRAMCDLGYFRKKGGWNEGPDLCYYDRESVMNSRGPYLYRVMSWKSDLVLFMRIRKPENCFEHLKSCSDDILEMFRLNEPGCRFRAEGKCKHGISYVFEGRELRHCACCWAAFRLHPRAEDIKDYIKLVELGKD